MEIIYRAYDGVEFDTENECYTYEKELKKLQHSFKAYDTNGIYLADNAEDAYIIEVETEEAVEYLRDVFGIDIDTPGVWVYDYDNRSSWVTVTSFKRAYAKTYKLLTTLEKLEKRVDE